MAEDKEVQDLSCIYMKLQQKHKFNCTCFADDQEEIDEHYLECNDAFQRVMYKVVCTYSNLNMVLFEVHNNVVTKYIYNCSFNFHII